MISFSHLLINETKVQWVVLARKIYVYQNLWSLEVEYICETRTQWDFILYFC